MRRPPRARVSFMALVNRASAGGNPVATLDIAVRLTKTQAVVLERHFRPGLYRLPAGSRFNLHTGLLVGFRGSRWRLDWVEGLPPVGGSRAQ